MSSHYLRRINARCPWYMWASRSKRWKKWAKRRADIADRKHARGRYARKIPLWWPLALIFSLLARRTA